MKEYSILIVDDSDIDRYLLKRVITKSQLPIEVFESEDGQQALDFLSSYTDNKKNLGLKFPPVIIFLDVNMPHVDGLEFLDKFSELRESQKEYQSCTLMLFSSSERQEDRDKAFSYNFVSDYLVKGDLGPKALKEKISKVLSNAPFF